MRRAFALILAALASAGCGNDEYARDDSVDSAATGWPIRPPAAGAAPVTADRKLPGLYPAGSRLKDKKAIGGFGGCDNYPFDLADHNWGAAGEISVVAFPREPAAYFKHRGFAVRLINRTSGVVPFHATDSMLSIIRQAKGADGQWRDIETPQDTFCGNSYHRVFLPPGQYWQFPAREYAGPVAVKFRFRLDPGGGRPAVYSNEFDGQVTAAQLADNPVKRASE